MKYEPVFGDQSLFDNAPLGTELVGHSGGFYKNSPDGPIYCGGCTFTTDEYRNIGFIAARRIIKTPVQHSDDTAVDLFAAKMKEKLKKSRDKGRRGWESCQIEHLITSLKDHISKGDHVDVANFAMMISQRGESIKTLVWTVEDQKAGRLPDVGAEVQFNFYQSAVMRQGVIKYIDDQVVVIQTEDVTRPFCYETCKVVFTPIETPEEKAERLRSEWVEHAFDLYVSSPKNDVASMGDVYDALLSGELMMPGKVDE